jgi:hypothetical protein
MRTSRILLTLSVGVIFTCCAKEKNSSSFDNSNKVKTIIKKADYTIDTLKNWVCDTVPNKLDSFNLASMFIDRNDIKWFGHRNGILKLDGSNLLNYHPKSGGDNLGAKNIGEDISGNIYFSFDSIVPRVDKVLQIYGRLIKFDGKNFVSLNFGNDDFYSFCEDTKNNLWIGTTNQGIFLLPNTYYQNNIESFGNWITKMSISSSGIIWAITPNGAVLKFYKDIWTIIKEGCDTCSAPSSIATDSKENIWLGTDQGIMKFDGTGWSALTVNEGLLNNTIFSLVVDKADNLWAGTPGGLNRYNGNKVEHYFDEATTGYYIDMVSKDNEGNIWAMDSYKDLHEVQQK